MADKAIEVEVAFAKSHAQVLVRVTVLTGESVAQAIKKSAILEQFPEIELTRLKVGIFGKLCALSKKVEPGDRIEIYRPLRQSPMEARRNRAVK
jgi:putative ubiquitin-RnfH superfamily antitoxin RatB of RatAB toxin-antitoxin module